MKKFIILCALLLCSACASFNPGKQPRGVIRVQVTVVDNETKQPLQGATVSCNGRVMITGPEGRAFFNEVPIGLMKLYVRKNGYWDLGSTNVKETDQQLTAHLRKVVK